MPKVSEVGAADTGTSIADDADAVAGHAAAEFGNAARHEDEGIQNQPAKATEQTQVDRLIFIVGFGVCAMTSQPRPCRIATLLHAYRVAAAARQQDARRSDPSAHHSYIGGTLTYDK